MKPTEILMEEHKAILRLLDVLRKISENLQNGNSVSVNTMAKAVDFIRTFADKCHHAKEEHGLFKFMEERGMPRYGGPIGVMLMEHDNGRDYVSKMEEAVNEMKNGKDAVRKYAENALNFVGLLTQHIHKEDNILYPMSEEMMEEGDEEKLLLEFEKLEKERVGEGVHEKYLKVLEELEKDL